MDIFLGNVSYFQIIIKTVLRNTTFISTFSGSVVSKSVKNVLFHATFPKDFNECQTTFER